MIVNRPTAVGSNEQKTAQLRVKGRGPGGGMLVTAYGNSGTVFFETPARARMLLDTGSFELVNAVPTGAKPVGPQEAKPTGPTETKVDEKKTESSSEKQDGRSTASVSSREPGSDAESSSSAADPASTKDSAKPSKPRGRPAGKKHA